MSDFAPDYVDVSERIRLLREKHPDASLQGFYRLEDVNGITHVVYEARCYRSPEDVRPGVGFAWEQVPGKTPFTRGSELMNAETSAWGRAIVAAGAADSKRVASADEIRAQVGERNQSALPVSKARVSKLKARASALTAAGVSLAERRHSRLLPPIAVSTVEELDEWSQLLYELELEVESSVVAASPSTTLGVPAPAPDDGVSTVSTLAAEGVSAVTADNGGLWAAGEVGPQPADDDDMGGGPDVETVAVTNVL